MADRFRVACGVSEVEFRIPPDLNVTVARSKNVATIDLVSEAERALQQPIGGPPLADLAKPGQKVCIVFTDATRNVPDSILVAALLRHLERAGIRSKDILLLCGVGMHRPSTLEEKQIKLGREIVRNYQVLDASASDKATLTYLGNHDGIPLWVSRLATEADLLIATGIVEPHQYAGYSGGRKTVAVGAGGEDTIAATHSPIMIERKGVRLGNIEGNPFHEALAESARRAGLRFIINVVKDGSGQVVAVAAGEPQATFAYLVSQARLLYEVNLGRKFDIVIAGVGYPKDANLYQATRAVTYIHFAPWQVLNPGGVIIVPAPCQEGVGLGLGEQRFVQAMSSSTTPAGVVATLRGKVTLAGEQRAYLLAKALENCRVIIVGASNPMDVRACHMTPSVSMEEALSLARSWTRQDADVLVVPHSLLTVLRGPNESSTTNADSGQR
ncbi:MAG: nickel-dependent lactate racemase [Anaerolineae bacterium]